MKTLYPSIISILIISIGTLSSHAQLRAPENVAIGFYGQVTDQNGKPVADAEVTFDLVASFMAEDRTQSRPMKMQTDSGGKFAVTEVTGYGIDGLVIRKEGYELSKKTLRSYVFGLKPDYKPNPNNPVLFKMWKLTGKERLVGSSWRGKVAEDGTTNRFGLLNGSLKESGSLEIVCKRNASAPLSNGHFSFECVISILGGGIQPTQDEFTYLAPENGYSPSFVIDQTADATAWRPDVHQEFYVKTREGHYGRLFVEWYPWQTPTGHCKWDCSINPSGSRNLER